MSFVGNIFSSGQGLQYRAGAGNIAQAATPGQAQEQYQQAQEALKQQQAFAQALQSQGTQGMAAQTNLGQQLSAQAQGLGPNPAQAMLAQQTAANTANQAALMAGQRGSSQNAGLLARQAAQQGAATQQQAVGQAATMQAQQQLAAQQALQNLSATQIGQQAGATQAYTGATQAEQQNILNAIAQQNAATVGMQSNINQANAAIQGVTAGLQGQLFGGLLQGAAAGMADGGEVPNLKENYDQGGMIQTAIKLAPLLMANKGGKVQKMADGGLSGYDPSSTRLAVPLSTASPNSAAQQAQQQSQPRSNLGKSIQSSKQAQAMPQQQSGINLGQNAVQQGGVALGSAVGKGVKNIFSSGSDAATQLPDAGPAPEQPMAAYDTSVKSYGIPTDQFTGAKGLPLSGKDASASEEQSPKFQLMQSPIESAKSRPDIMSQLDVSQMAAWGGAIYADGDEVQPDDQNNQPQNNQEFKKKLQQVGQSITKATGGNNPQQKARGGKINVGSKLKEGGHVPGKASVSGDSYKNDTVKALLSPGEVVIPRSVMHSKDPVNNAAKFVASILMRKKDSSK